MNSSGQIKLTLITFLNEEPYEEMLSSVSIYLSSDQRGA